VDWVTGILELLGKWSVGNKNRWGFAVNLLSCFGWLAYIAMRRDGYGFLVVVVPSIFINVRNFIKWTKEAEVK